MYTCMYHLLATSCEQTTDYIKLPYKIVYTSSQLQLPCTAVTTMCVTTCVWLRVCDYVCVTVCVWMQIIQYCNDDGSVR